MTRTISYIPRLMAVIALVTFCACGVSAAETAAQVMKRAAALMERASGIKATFNLVSAGRTVRGTLKSSAAGFALSTPGYSTWYDGRTMWTYSASSQETTVTVPTAEELREANPLLMVSQYASGFTPAFASRQQTGTHTVVLSPKSQSNSIKSVTVVLNKSNYRPVSVTVVPRSGNTLKVDVTSLVTDASFSKKDFIYPAKSYPKAEIVDLR